MNADWLASYNLHIEKICKDNAITIVFRENAGGRAWIISRRIRPINSAVTYAITLHDIAHILGSKAKLRLEKETNAWLWTGGNAITWIKVMDKTMRRCLGSYLHWYKRKKPRLGSVDRIAANN